MSHYYLCSKSKANMKKSYFEYFLADLFPTLNKKDPVLGNWWLVAGAVSTCGLEQEYALLRYLVLLSASASAAAADLDYMSSVLVQPVLAPPSHQGCITLLLYKIYHLWISDMPILNGFWSSTSHKLTLAGNVSIPSY